MRSARYCAWCVALQSTQFLKLAKDCQIIGMTPVTEADTYVAYTAEVKRKHRVGIKRMNYNDFLTALMKLSTKVCVLRLLHNLRWRAARVCGLAPVRAALCAACA